MKEIGDLEWQHAFEFEAAEQIRLRFIRLRKLPGFRGCQLGQQFGKLPKLHQRCVWIVAKIPFGQGAKTGELRVMRGKKAEVGSLDRRTPCPTPWCIA
jgi:hypothetical protein